MDNMTNLFNEFRQEILHIIHPIEYPTIIYQQVGMIGIEEIHNKGITRDKSAFANSLSEKIGFMPLEVVRSICLAAAYLGVAIGCHEEGDPDAIHALACCASELGYIKGFSFGMEHEHEYSNKNKSIYGAKGAIVRHQPTRALKEWALLQAKQMRGADIEIARKLSALIPPHLADASKDPQRLIYEELLKAGKARTDG